MADDTPIASDRTTLQQSGGGDGVALYLPSDQATLLDLDPGTELDIDVKIEDGHPVLRVTDLPTGISEDEFLDYADANDWELITDYDDVYRNEVPDDHWSYTFRTPDDIRVSIDNDYHLGGDLANNLIIETPPVEIKTVDQYRPFIEQNEATPPEITISVSTNDGLWMRAYGSPRTEYDDPVPDPETMEMLLDKSDHVTARFTATHSTVRCSFDDIDETMTLLREAVAVAPSA